MNKFIIVAAAALLSSTAAYATTNTTTSPTNGPLPAGVTQVGGVVADLTGLNGVRVVSQLAASTLYVGFSGAGNNPLTIGTQSGFSPAVIAALGGGLSEASFRITLFDGDSAPGNFDFNDNTFFVDGALIGNWSSVATERTDGTGTVSLGFGTGFGNNILSTGFFSTVNAGTLASIFGGLGDGALTYSLFDNDPNDNFFDFTQGVNGGLVNVGQGPIIAPGVPEPSTWAMLLLGFGAVGAAMRRRRQMPVALA